MVAQVNVPLTSAELARELGLKHVGADLMIRSVCSVDSIQENALFFSKAPLVASLAVAATAILTSGENLGAGAAILSSNPRLDFARALTCIKDRGGFNAAREGAVVHPTARVGAGVVLGCGVTVGAWTIVGSNVVIGDRVSIGERCVIKSGAVIGEDGFGFERDELGRPVRLVHLGSVVIGNDVEIGSLCTVCRGTIDDTRIEDFAKIDDHVHVAHNVSVGRGAMVTACVELSGGVEIGEGVWVGPNSSVIQKVRIGAGAIVGIAANVIRDVPEGVTVAGNPAKFLGG